MIVMIEDLQVVLLLPGTRKSPTTDLPGTTILDSTTETTPKLGSLCHGTVHRVKITVTRVSTQDTILVTTNHGDPL
jgi:hypothetical protein